MRTRFLAFGCALVLSAQDGGFPKPTAHHLAQKEQAGTWTAVARMYADPAKPPTVFSKGTETNTLVAGGLWLKSEFKADMMGMAFEGHGLFGYDTQQGAHVGSWVDNSGTWMAVTKGTCAQGCREQTLFFEGYDEVGKPASFKEIHTQPDHDHRRMVMFIKGKDGAFRRTMEMDYTRSQ